MLFRKRGDESVWLRYVRLTSAWMVTSTEGKDENNGTSGLVYEAAIGGRASRCGAVEFCLKDWWLDRGGEAIAPSIGDWGAYDPRRRPWYEKAMDDRLPEAFWISSELTTWYGDVAINVSHSAEQKKGPTTRRPMIVAPQN